MRVSNPGQTLRTVFVHVGTHKTGSTALQYFLTRNEGALAKAGLFVPRSGRLADHPAGCGHHNIAMELFVPSLFDSRLGSLDDLVAEIAGSGFARACISSEQFETAYDARAGLERMRDAFAAIGYTVRIIMYLRPQADYFESLYAEIVKGGHFYEFERFLNEIMRNGSLWGGLLLSYDELIGTFEAVFSRRNVIVRPYLRSGNLDRILYEFARTIGLTNAQLNTCKLSPPEPVNARASFGATMAAVYASAVGQTFDQQLSVVPPDLSEAVNLLDGSFHPLRLREIVAIVRRFGLGNLRVSWRFRAAFGCVSAARLLRAIRQSLGGRDEDRKRRQLLERMIAQMRSTEQVT